MKAQVKNKNALAKAVEWLCYHLFVAKVVRKNGPEAHEWEELKNYEFLKGGF